MQDHRNADQEGVILPFVQFPDVPVEDICHLTLSVVRQVWEQLIGEASELSAYEQVSTFAPGRYVPHGAVQASAVGVPGTSRVAAKARLLANMCFPLPVTRWT